MIRLFLHFYRRGYSARLAWRLAQNLRGQWRLK